MAQNRTHQTEGEESVIGERAAVDPEELTDRPDTGSTPASIEPIPDLVNEADLIEQAISVEGDDEEDYPR